MEREILFRGKRTDNGEWVCGDLICYEEDMPSINVDNGDWHSNYRVDPDTIGQFTGLRDCDGKNIFHGDIVLFGNDYYEIQWDDDNACFVTKHRGVKRYACAPETLKMTYMRVGNVIGNVHDNPELAINAVS